MQIVNRIHEGVHQDNNEYDQPENTMRESLNGVITDVGSGHYVWRNMRGTKTAFSFEMPEQYFSHCNIRDRLFIITLNAVTNFFSLYEITVTEDEGTKSLLFTGSNTAFNFSFDHPIRVIWGFYETEEIQRIYLSDWYNPPRVFNISNGSSVSITEKFSRFMPIISHVYGKFTPTGLVSGGNLKGGTYFFAWLYYTDDGYFTDWSYLSNPVSVFPGTPSTGFESYQEIEGAAPDENTNKKLQFTISDIDTDYSNIRICAFYSNDQNLVKEGTIIYDGKISAASMDFTYLGSELLGSVVIDDLIESSIVIDKFKDSVYAKSKNVIANVSEREELDVTGLNSDGSNSYLDADISVQTRQMPLDTFGYPDVLNSLTDNKSLFGLMNNDFIADNHGLARGMWFQAITETKWSDVNPPTTWSTYTYQPGQVFYISVYSTSVVYISGTFKPVLVIRKYLKAGGVEGGDVNTNYEFDVIEVDNDFVNYKSSKVSHYLKGYPQGEKVRLGILFFDKTGRPFYARALKNSNSTYGTGDTNIPKRSATNPITTVYEPAIGGISSDPYYVQANASIKCLQVDDLDITDVVDKIGGFMIVRCPIVHQYKGMAIVMPTKLEGNDVHSFTGFFGSSVSLINYDGCYEVFSPEDIFSKKGFVLEKDDEIENLYNLKPYMNDESTTIGEGTFTGFGRRESNRYDFYQKFLVPIGSFDTTNGGPGVSHKVKSVVPIGIGEDDVPVNPLDGTKKYKFTSSAYYDGDNNHYGVNGKHSIVMLDIDEDTDGIKGFETLMNTYPLALLCAIKKPNENPYGGFNESSIANSVFMSTGHFQEINDDVLADIAQVINGETRYIFNGIEIYGGDTFINLVDIKRLYCNESIDPNQNLGHTIIFPVESQMNLAMREGNHVAKDRSYDPSYNTDGIRMLVGSDKFEEFNYNDGYSSDDIGDYYVPMPFNFKNISVFDDRIRYSLEKNNNENRDSFRRFAANDYIDLNNNKGQINNIRFRDDLLIYWQPDEVGTIPINERALTQNSIGQPVQLGVSGIFQRYDARTFMLGNSNQFGLVESPFGFHWYDAKRKIFISIDSSYKITEESIIKGFDNFLQTLPFDMYKPEYDNPRKDYGMIGGYDPYSKYIFYSFFTNDGNKYTIGIHSLLNKFCGNFNLNARDYFTYIDKLFLVDDAALLVAINGIGAIGTFFGTMYPSYFTIIVKENSNEVKKYDKWDIIGNKNMFTSIVFSNSDQDMEEQVAEYTPQEDLVAITDANGNPLTDSDGQIIYAIGDSNSGMTIVNRNYVYLKRRWFGNFPLLNRERFSDGYLKIKFKMSEPYLVEFYMMNSQVRKFL